MKLRPLFPWVGGKYKIADQIMSLMDIDFNVKKLVSPTCGGLGFDIKFYIKHPNVKIYASDSNKWLIDLYNHIKYTPKLFLKKIEKLNSQWKILNKKQRKIWYYDLRNNFNFKYSGIEKSVAFFALIKTGYNGLMQINDKNELTTAFGFGVINELINIDNYEKFVYFTENVKFIHRDIDQSIVDVDRETLVYIDPLYKDSKQMYYSRENNFLEEKLVSYMIECHKKGSPLVAMSNSYDPLFWKKMLSKFEINTVYRKQGIHRNVVEKGRPIIKENLLILRDK